MELSGYSAIGPRDVNEDNFFSAEFGEVISLSHGISAFAVVSDGMGGYQGGDIASNIVITGAEHYLDQLLEMAEVNTIELDVPGALKEMVSRAHASILEEARANGGRSMGATFVGVFVSRDHAWIGHVGDSRAYRIRDGIATQLTEDHSQVGRMLARGVITEEEAQNHPNRNKIEQALGFTVMQVDIDECELEAGDALLLCSDGVYTAIDSAAMAQNVSESHSAQEAAEKIVKLALARGTDDNSTALVIYPFRQTNMPQKTPTIIDGLATTEAPKPVRSSIPTQRKRALHVRTGNKSTDNSALDNTTYGEVLNPTRVSPAVANMTSSHPSIRRQSSKDCLHNIKNLPHLQLTRQSIIVLAVALMLLVIIAAIVMSALNQNTSTGPVHHDDEKLSEQTNIQQDTMANPMAHQDTSISIPNGESLENQHATASSGYARGQSFTVGEYNMLRFIDADGNARRFDNVFPETYSNPIKFMQGETVFVVGESDSFGSSAYIYYRLSDAYYDDLMNDVDLAKHETHEFNSELSKLITYSNEEYYDFLQVLLNMYKDDEELAAAITGLLVVQKEVIQPLSSNDTPIVQESAGADAFNQEIYDRWGSEVENQTTIDGLFLDDSTAPTQTTTEEDIPNTAD